MSKSDSVDTLTQEDVVSKAYEVASSGNGAVLAIFTDEVKWLGPSEFNKYMQPQRMDHLLEVRAYNASQELHAFRSCMGCKLYVRLITDEGEDDNGFYVKETWRLDIDEKAPATNPRKGYYKSIAGGSYTLPVTNAREVTVRNYYEYDEDGLAQFVDFRIVSIEARGKERKHA